MSSLAPSEIYFLNRFSPTGGAQFSSDYNFDPRLKFNGWLVEIEAHMTLLE
jgi:hypothetical protein